MKKLFLSNLVLVITLNVLIKPFYIFVIDRGVQNTVGASEYGLYFALMNFVYLFQIINDVGLQNYNHSVLSKYHNLIPKYLPKILAAKLALALVFTIAVCFIALIIGFGSYIWPLLMFIIINQILVSMVMYLRTTLSALGHYKLDSILSVADKLLMIIGIGYLLWFSDKPIEIRDFIVGQTIALGSTLILTLYLLWHFHEISFLPHQFDSLFSVALFRKSLPYAFVLLLMTLYTRMDGVMLERLLPDGKEQAGIYAAAYRILDAFGNVGLLFAGLLLPMFAKLIRKAAKLDDLVITARNALLAFTLTTICISVVYYDPIISLLYKDATRYWAEVYQILFVSYLGISLAYIYGTLLTANESIRSMNKIFMAGVILNFVLNIVFIALWKAKGAAIATLITQLLTAGLLILLAHRDLALKRDLNGWFKLGIFTLVVLVLVIWSKSWPFFWIISVVTTGLIAFILASLLKLFEWRAWLMKPVEDL